jgi:hypothetical protein
LRREREKIIRHLLDKITHGQLLKPASWDRLHAVLAVIIAEMAMLTPILELDFKRAESRRALRRG